MSTIRDVSDRILRVLNGGNVKRDSKFHILDIRYMVRDGAAKFIKGDWFAERNEGGKDIDSRYVVPFWGLELKKNDQGENYIEIPVKSWIRLPYGAGIRSVRPDHSGTPSVKTKNVENRPFIPVPNDFEDIYWQLPAGSIEQQVGWMLRKDKIVFTKAGEKTLMEHGMTKVAMSIVTADPAAVGIDEQLPLSAEMVSALITEVILLFQEGSPKVVDAIDNQNPNISSAE